MTTPGRRWSFGLRTLFVVTGTVAIAVSWLHHQKRRANERDGYFLERSNGALGYGTGSPDSAPFPLDFFGAQGVGLIQMAWNARAEQIERARRLFPEAAIEMQPPPPEESLSTQADRP